MTPPPRLTSALCALALAFGASPACAAPTGHDLESEVQAAEQDVVRCFQGYGLEPPRARLVDRVTVYDSVEEARRTLARKHRMSVEAMPPTFSGTVEGRSLHLVGRDAYERLWRGLYPAEAANGRAYRQLIVHELTHKAHEDWARARYGTIDAMGPAWFYEGFAVACAGQFADAPLMRPEELHAAIGGGRTPTGSYPEYGRVVRSLGAIYGMDVVIDAAARPGFPDSLWRD